MVQDRVAVTPRFGWTWTTGDTALTMRAAMKKRKEFELIRGLRIILKVWLSNSFFNLISPAIPTKWECHRIPLSQQQVMAWCCQATGHYLSQCWPRSMSPYGITGSQLVKPLHADYIWENIKIYHQSSKINCTKSPHLSVSCLVLQLSLPNQLKPVVKLRIQM